MDAQGMPRQVHEFAESAKRFCAWSEGTAASPEDEACAALEHLSSLYQQALSLPDIFSDEDPTEVDDNAWSKVYSRFGSLPFNDYAQCFDPAELSADAVTADIADDLADIWRDLKQGLSLFDAGHVDAAATEWRQSFWQHWGRHAAGGIYALHSWCSQNASCAAE